jgi:hypothetical protein
MCFQRFDVFTDGGLADEQHFWVALEKLRFDATINCAVRKYTFLIFI